MQVGSHAAYFQPFQMLHSNVPAAHALASASEPFNSKQESHVIKPVESSAASSEAGNQTLHSQRHGAFGTDDTSSPERDSDYETKAESKEQAKKAQEERQEVLEQQQIKELAARDREVRAHEQAHMAVGGQYAGAASYTYERGPNGVSYAVGGEVPISTGKAATPEETIQKAQVVRRAALAPAEPSPADRQVAAAATRMEAQARRDLALEQRQEAELKASEETSATEGDTSNSQSTTEDYAATAKSEAGTAGTSNSNTPSGFISSQGTSVQTLLSKQYIQSYNSSANDGVGSRLSQFA